MVHAWQQTIVIDEQRAKKLIEEQVDISVTTISLIGQGWDNMAYLINKKYIFRFPRRARGIEFMENEILILPYLAQHISFPFSFPEYIGTATSDYEAPFAGYTVLSGSPLSEMHAKYIDDTVFARILAQWLKQLHTIPLLEAHKKTIHGDQSWRYSISNRIERALKSLDQYVHHFSAAGFEKKDIINALTHFQSYEFDSIQKASYCHGDLYSRHLLVDDRKQLTGIIDWGDVHIGNSGTDLSVGFMIFSETALRVFFDEYGPLDALTYQLALFRALWHPILLLPYCYEQQEKTMKEWVTRALKRVLE